MSAILEKLRKASAFCFFSMPHKQTTQLYFQQGMETEMPKEGICFSPFHTNDKLNTVFISAEESAVLQDVDLDLLRDFKFSLDDEDVNENSFEVYKSNFDTFHDELNSDSSIEKLVLSRVLDVAWTGNPICLFKEIKNRYPDAFVYLLYHPDTGGWLAASPETLLSKEGNMLTTMALAGTQTSESIEAVVWKEKEIDEHRFVVDYIEKKLRDSGCQSIQIDKSKTIKAGKVWHLKTDIRGVLTGDKSWFDLAKALHPTPAVCGTPMESAKSFILEHENHARNYYCGFIGPYTDNSADIFVNLRCMQLFKHKVSLYLGGGITRASQLKDEWKETENKALTLLSCLQEK